MQGEQSDQTMTDFCIIGSGPSAISAAVALTRRSLRVTMLDAGITLEKSRRETVTRLAATTPDCWNPADVAQIKEGVEATSSGIPLKRLYGSKFPFSSEGAPWTIKSLNAGIQAGFSQGGLSNVWGAGMLPFHRDDIADWPISANDLDRGYHGVLSFVPCAGAVDDLQSLFPHQSPDLQSFRPSSQGEAFLRDAARARLPGVTVGQSRLAVHARPCVRCGLCLYGCPYELIYNSAQTLRELQTLPNFTYRSGFTVERLKENSSSVEIEGGSMRLHAGRVFLGAGTIASTAILLASLGDYNVPVRLLDSFYFLLPLLRFSSASNIAEERLHTLAQAFIAMRDPAGREPFVHFSIYGYNDLLIPSLRASIGALGGIESLSSRTMVAGGYLHSGLSPGLSMTLAPGEIFLEGDGPDSPQTAAATATAKQAAFNLLKHAFALRTLPLIPAMRFPAPGRGFHTGGSFPMRHERVHHTSDIEGRPAGFDRVHLIDASCLPSIPATTITLPVMANAWRIANLAADREGAAQ